MVVEESLAKSGHLTIHIFSFEFLYFFLVAYGSSLLSSKGEQGLLPSCGAWDSHCGSFSHCRA